MYFKSFTGATETSAFQLSVQKKFSSSKEFARYFDLILDAKIIIPLYAVNWSL